MKVFLEAFNTGATPFLFKPIVMNLKIFTDGAFSPLRDTGGVGIVFYTDRIIKTYNRRIPHATINQCELLAVMIALNAISKPIDSVEIYSDSQYVVGCATKGWQRKKNVNLWKHYDEIYQKASNLCQNITINWCKGHESDSDLISKLNNVADKLAVEASQEYA